MDIVFEVLFCASIVLIAIGVVENKMSKKLDASFIDLIKLKRGK